MHDNRRKHRGRCDEQGIKEKYKDTLYIGLGLACLGIGLNAVISNFGKSEYPVLFIVSIALGSIAGTALDLDGRFARLINKRSKRSSVPSARARCGRPVP